MTIKCVGGKENRTHLNNWYFVCCQCHLCQCHCRHTDYYHSTFSYYSNSSVDYCRTMDRFHLCRYCHTNIHRRLVLFAIDTCSNACDHPTKLSSMPSAALYHNNHHSCDLLSHRSSRAMPPMNVVACAH